MTAKVFPYFGSPLASAATSMPSSYRSNYGPQSKQPAQERRRQPRTEDPATEAFIRKYMKLAKAAMKEPATTPQATKNAAADRAQRYLDLADVCLQKKGKAA